MSLAPFSPAVTPKSSRNKRRSALQRLTAAHLASMGGTLADTIGEGTRQRLVWLGLLAMPLLFPVALPGMGSAVGALCLLVAFGLCTGRSIALPGWLARRELSERVKSLLTTMVNRTLHLLVRYARPRLLPLSNQPLRLFNGVMLVVAGLSMIAPVPLVSFDNVLPALAIVLMAWGLRLRDGLMLLAGYVATVAAVVSVMLLWWGGSLVASYVVSLG